GAAEAGNITCGDVVHLAIKVKDGLVLDARFRAQGCATAIASADAICELIIGKSVTEAQMIDSTNLALALGGLPDDRINCATIVLDALRACLEQARSRPHPTPPVDRTLGQVEAEPVIEGAGGK
ncbi:MAG: iron-sulfur cluster assembly scaffold protein, partial [Actinomycetota bacterium]